MNSYSFLFNSIKAAQDVAYALRGAWDGCNGVELLAHDHLALKLAAALCDAEYCAAGSSCHILDNTRESDNIRESRNVLILGFRNIPSEVFAAQLAGCLNRDLQSGREGFWQMVSKVAQDVAELQQSMQLARQPAAEQMHASGADEREQGNL